MDCKLKVRVYELAEVALTMLGLDGDGGLASKRVCTTMTVMH